MTALIVTGLIALVCLAVAAGVLRLQDAAQERAWRNITLDRQRNREAARRLAEPVSSTRRARD